MVQELVMVRSRWTWDSALAFLKRIRPGVRAVGYDLALAGSVLHSGESEKDLDVVLFPLTTVKQDQGALRGVLIDCGLIRRAAKDQVQKHWRAAGSLDDKHVEVWCDDVDRRIDFFFLK
jgi:hypothetical protein